MEQRYNTQLSFVLISVWLLVAFDTYNCSPKLLVGQSGDSSIIWKDRLIKNLNIHVQKLEKALEQYLDNRYMPYLEIVASECDFDTRHVDSGMSKQTKSILRLSTLHAYLMIHQTALVSSSVAMLSSYLKTKNKDYKLNDNELKSILLYLNYQIRAYTYEHKSEYLLEYTHLCSSFEWKGNRKQKSNIERLVDFVKAKTKISLLKIRTTRDHFLQNKQYLPDDIKKALDFKENGAKVLGFSDMFFRKLGLEAIITGYMYMSSPLDVNVKQTYPRNLDFKKYFMFCKSESETRLVTQNKDKFGIDGYDPILPIDNINQLEKFGIVISEEDKNMNSIATSKLKQGFVDELMITSFEHEKNEVTIFGTVIYGFEDADIARIINNHDKNNEKARKLRSELIDGISKMMIDYEIVKSCVLDRFINLAKSFLNYEQDSIRKSTFIVPFNDLIFALNAQRLLFAFYPVMISQASYTMSDFGHFNFDLHKDFVSSIGGRISKTSELYERYERLYLWIKNYKKREDVISKLRSHRLRVEMEYFRSLPVVSQGYYHAMNDYTLGNVLSLFLEPSYNEMNQFFDFVQNRIVVNLLGTPDLAAMSMTNGKSVESNVKLWLSTRVTK